MKFTDKTVTNSNPELKLPEGKTNKIFFDDIDDGFGLAAINPICT